MIKFGLAFLSEKMLLRTQANSIDQINLCNERISEKFSRKNYSSANFWSTFSASCTFV